MSLHGEPVLVADWLAGRTPPAPAALQSMLRQLAGDTRCLPQDLPGVLVNLSTRLFGNLGDSRESALHLLAADALITYAMEAGADIGVDATQEAIKTLGSAMAR